MKIGICDIQGEISHRFDLPYDTFEQYRAYLLTTCPATDFICYNILQGQIPSTTDPCDAFVLTGSACGVYEDHSWIAPLTKFIQEAHASERKVLGICFGHQMIAHALGGDVRKYEKGWSLGIKKTKFTSPFGNKVSYIPETQEFLLFYSHQDQVLRLPSAAKGFASHENCSNAGFTIDKHILGIQGHPEYSLEYMKKLVTVLKPRVPATVFAEATNSLVHEKAKPEVTHSWIKNWLSLG